MDKTNHTPSNNGKNAGAPTQAKIPRPTKVDEGTPQVEQNIYTELTRAKMSELRAEIYKDCVGSLKWALRIIVTLVVVFVGVVAFKSSSEYSQAIEDVKEAVKDAKQAAKDARDWEEKARGKLDGVDDLVAVTLKKMEDRGDAQIKRISEEAEKQREINELWSEGIRVLKAGDFESAADYFIRMDEISENKTKKFYNNWAIALVAQAKGKSGNEADELFGQAFQKYEMALRIEPGYYLANFNWGNALSEKANKKQGIDADTLLIQACEKYDKANLLNPDDHDVFNNWGLAISARARGKQGTEAEMLFKQSFIKFEKALQIKINFFPAYINYGCSYFEWSRKKENGERVSLLEKAKGMFLKAESIRPGEGAYNLACIYAILGEINESKRWLEICEQNGVLPTYEYAFSDDDLESVRDKDWFKQIRWKMSN